VVDVEEDKRCTQVCSLKQFRQRGIIRKEVERSSKYQKFQGVLKEKQLVEFK